MYKGSRSGRGTLWTIAVMLMMTGLVMVIVGGCGGDDSKAVSSTTASAPSTPSTTSAESDGEGVLIGKEIFATFDEMAAKAAELSKDKPEPAVLKPQLEELYASYLPKMTELNAKYLALQESDINQFRACNGYHSSNRPQHITAMQNACVEAVKYYNFQLGDQEIVSLLNDRPIELLDVAFKQN